MERQDADTPTAHEPKRRTIVCLYAQADEPFYLQLKKSLNLWERQRQVRWLEVLPGEEPAAIWHRHVQRADLILLLLSPDFFSDDLCYQTMHLALQERAVRQVPVVPVLIRAMDWRLSACKDLAVVPRNEHPVASWALPDEAYAFIGADLAHLLPAWGLLVPPRATVFRVPDLPEGYVPRPAAFQQIKSAVLERRMGQTTAITTALRGAGGFGKTTLAMALCHDPDIQTAFPEMLWVELGEQPPRALDLLNRLLASLERSQSEALTLQEARERWQVALRDRACLLVIDDVWQAETLLPLLEGGPQCVRLVTTRNDVLLPKDAARVLVDAMSQREAITLLCQDKHLPAEIFQARYQPQLEALVERLGCWPLLLTLARGMLTDLVVDYHLSIAEALTTITQAYQTRGVTAFRLDNVEERLRTVEACLNVSLQHLKTFTHPHYHATERYQELAVFPEDTDIPLATLRIYWKGSAGLEPWETKDLCIRLHRLSLLLHCDLGVGTIRLHDVVRSYLIQRAGSDLPSLHGRLLDTCQQKYHATRWADLPDNEPYLWDHLAEHLAAAGRLAELVTTVKDLRYLAHKTLARTVYAAEADLVLAEQQVPTDVPLRLLRRNFSNMGHLLNRCSTYTEIAAVLSSRLVHLQELSDPGQAFEPDIPRPYLASWHQLPDLPDPALIRTLGGHTGTVEGCAISPAGDFIVSASTDGTLKVWDARTGEERRTLSGHTGPVVGCAISPAGDFIVSASRDGTLKVWDARTGKERRTLSGHTSYVYECAISPAGDFIVSSSADRTLKVWDARTGKERRTLSGFTGPVVGCAISPAGDFIVSASTDGTLKVWDARTGEERRTLGGYTSGLRGGCPISLARDFIVSASDDGTLKVWDAHTGEEKRTLRGHTFFVTGCAISPAGDFIVSSSADRTLKVWDARTGKERRTLRGHASWVTGCAISQAGDFIVSASDDGTLKVWDAHTGKERYILRGHASWVTGCAISPAGNFIVSASDDGTLKVWDAPMGACLSTLYVNGRLEACAFHPDGKHIVAVGPAGVYFLRWVR